MSNLLPPATPVPSAGDAKRAWRRLRLIALAVALVVLVVGGAGGYLVARGFKKTSYRAACGTVRCIPSLPASSVIDALEGRGFACAEKAGSWTCRLRIGDTRYESRVSQQDGLIHSYDNSVNTERPEVSEPAKAFLAWFAALPFSDDPVLAAEIDGWLIPRLSGGTDTRVSIGGYAYSLTAATQQSLRLDVWVGVR